MLPFNSQAPHFLQRAKVYCTKVLPLVFDNSLSYYEFLCRVCHKLNETIEAVNAQNLNIVEFEKMVQLEIEKFEAYIENRQGEFETDFKIIWEKFKTDYQAEWESFKTEIENKIFDEQEKNEAFKISITNEFQIFKNSIETGLEEWKNNAITDINTTIDEKISELTEIIETQLNIAISQFNNIMIKSDEPNENGLSQLYKTGNNNEKINVYPINKYNDFEQFKITETPNSANYYFPSKLQIYDGNTGVRTRTITGSNINNFFFATNEIVYVGDINNIIQWVEFNNQSNAAYNVKFKIYSAQTPVSNEQIDLAALNELAEFDVDTTLLIKNRIKITTTSSFKNGLFIKNVSTGFQQLSIVGLKIMTAFKTMEIKTNTDKKLIGFNPLYMPFMVINSVSDTASILGGLDKTITLNFRYNKNIFTDANFFPIINLIGNSDSDAIKLASAGYSISSYVNELPDDFNWNEYCVVIKIPEQEQDFNIKIEGVLLAINRYDTGF